MSSKIRDPERYKEAALRRRTERFDHCFDKGACFSDLDSIVEISGSFCVVEHKMTGQQIPTGQKRLLYELAKQPKFTVAVMWEDEDGSTSGWCRVVPGKPIVSSPRTEKEFTTRLTAWCQRARGHNP